MSRPTISLRGRVALTTAFLTIALSSTFAQTEDCDDSASFPLLFLPLQNANFEFPTSCPPQCPPGTICEELQSSLSTPAGVFACTQFTRDYGETCDDGLTDLTRLASPGCIRGRDLLCAGLPGREDEPAVCRRLVGEGGACGGSDLEWCQIFERNAPKLQCVDGVCRRTPVNNPV